MSRFSFFLTALCAIGGVLMLADLWLQPLPAEAQMPSDMRAQMSAVKEACKGDFEHFCAGVSPGQGRVIACLKAHAGTLSPDCAQGIAAMQAFRDHISNTVESPK